MEYKRIEKIQSGIVSPSKLRLKLLHVQKKRREEENAGTACSPLPNENDELEDQGASSDCKDLGVVHAENSTLVGDDTCGDSIPVMDSTAPSQDQENVTNLNSSRPNRSLEDQNADYDSGLESGGLSSFEFQRTERSGQHRFMLSPFSKPAPSKWDDTGKWIPTALPSDNQVKSISKAGTAHPQGFQNLVPKKSWFYGSRQPSIPSGPSAKIVTEVPNERVDTKQIDLSQVKREPLMQKFAFTPPVSGPSLEPANLGVESCSSVNKFRDSYPTALVLTEVPVPDSTIKSVSMRDMGTEMTPIASQEPSRTATPVRATTPTRSPSSSRPSTPGRIAPASSPANSSVSVLDHQVDLPESGLSEKELQTKTRREIAALSAQLGKTNIAAWASKEEEEKDASTSLKITDVEQTPKSVIETRASAWEEAEKAKFMARYKREEVKIQAWENREKAKAEAEMRRIELEVERMKCLAHEKLMNKLAAARHKAEEKFMVAEAKRNQQAAKTAERVDYIRRTGRIPSSFSFCGWCH
ncbi:uncharacterized protein LOC116249021 isoform X2 [Nymphaea colorata]|uniref:uncharacterized protein LOC116249021 isoform X2 n=1 Tax=Nymphaea colorata TaxID=210225 RepID=UPI00129D94B9|nr:uncharacterized protein LOC116249021 isoform X2 [Nymphaea colorata]